jgi:hypothetical protein
VSYFPVLKWLFLLLLVVSLAWKSAIRIDYSSDLEENVFRFLVRSNFVVTVSEEMIRDKRTFRATKSACRMLVTPISSRGWERPTMKEHTARLDQLFFVFGGRIYAEQPIWLTAADFVWYKILSELGSTRVRPTPILAVIASNNCDAERLPWYELSSASPRSN